MEIFKLAYRNLVGAGLRTWLSVGVLSFIYVLVIWHQGLFNGMMQQASTDYINDEIGGGQYWVDGYDPFDPLTLDDGHAVIPPAAQELIKADKASAVLIRQGTIYPQGRVQSVLIKGIFPEQKTLGINTRALGRRDVGLPILIGPIMASKNDLKPGDTLSLRWRDTNGTFDAADGEIVAIMDTLVPSIDAGQIWVALNTLQKMTALENQATMVVVDQIFGRAETMPVVQGWQFKGYNVLLEDLRNLVASKRIGGSVIYVILLFLAVLAIFDSQILSIFRRRKEIGTLMALGMVRSRVVVLFTLEGALHGVLAAILAAIYGIPLLVWSARVGIPIPGSAEEFGFALASRMFPVYTAGLLIGTLTFITLTVTVVSYLPSRQISRMSPTEALKGKRS